MPSINNRFKLHCVPKKWDSRNFECPVVSLLQLKLARDIGMNLAVKCINNLPPHLSYVSTLPDITQKLKHDTDELKHWHLRPYSSSTKPFTSGKHSCVHHAWRQRDVTSNTYCDLDTQLAFFRALAHQTGSFQNHSHCWDEDNISFRFLCNAR